jgi:hypothetical protein
MTKLSKMLKSEVPSYETTLPISKRKLTFRPFKVREEKILLMAIEEKSETAILRAVLNIIESCYDDVDDAGDLQTTDIEHMFIHLRAKSIGEIVEPILTCPYTDEKVKIKIDLTKIGLIEKEEVSDKIKISDTIGLSLNYPSINMVLSNNFKRISELGIDDSIKMMAVCIDEIWSADEIIKGNEVTLEEKVDLLEDLSPDSFKNIVKFFENMPSLGISIDYKTSDGEDRKLELAGLQDFFV